MPAARGLPGAIAGAVAEPPRVARAAVFCLGLFAVEIGGRRVASWRAGKARSLFQYLITHRDRPIPRETLIAALWPEPDRLAAPTSLKVSVHALRQTLAECLSPAAPGGGGAPPPLAVQAHDCGYQLTTAGVWLDVDEFERSCAAGQRLDAEGRPEEAGAWYARAARLYAGDFLGDSLEDWAIFRREALKDQYLHALTRLADSAFAGGEYQTCITYCQQLLSQDCCREETYRTLISCHARLGQRDRARRWFELCQRTLRSELDVDPEPATEHVYRQALHPAA